jgi:hypothetical protein
MGAAFTWANLSVAFSLELGALGALGFSAYRMCDAAPARFALSIAVPLVAAALWGAFAAPHPLVHLPVLAVAVKVLVFGGAATGLAASGHRTFGFTFAAVLVVNLVALHFAPPVSTRSDAATGADVLEEATLRTTGSSAVQTVSPSQLR